jgi:outer membrane receptor for ferrienterochelin and colicins
MLKSTLLTAAAALALGSTVSAQSIDYKSLELIFGEPVTTSATGKPQRASDAPASMTIVSKDEIRRSGATSLPRILKRFAGIDVSQAAAEGYDVFIRGGTTSLNPGLLVLVDGRQVYLDHYGYTDWSGLGIQLDDIQQVEIVKGPNSALFGFNAAVGVVNIVTINPAFSDRRVVSAAIGPDGETAVSGVSTFKLSDSAALRLSAGYRASDEFADTNSEILAVAGTPAGDPEATSIALDGQFQLADKTALKLEATYNEFDKYAANPSSNGLLFFESETQSYRAQVSHEGFGGLLKVGAYLNELEQSFAGSTHEQSVLVVDAQHIFKIGARDSFRVLGEYRQNEFQTVEASDPRILFDLAGQVGYDAFAVGGMWERVLTDTLTSTVAVRLDSVELFQDGAIDPVSGFAPDDFDQNFSEISYNAGLVWKPTDADTLRAIVARGAQSPSLIALGVSIAFPSATAPGGVVNLPGDPSIEPSSVSSYELGYVRALSDNTQFAATAFFTDRQDIIQFAGVLPTSVPPQSSLVTFSQFQDGDYQTAGLELSLGRKEETSNWQLNYAFVDVQEDIPGQTFFGQPALPAAFEDMTASHRLNAVYGRKIGRLTGDFHLNYTSETLIPLSAGLGQTFATRDVDESFNADFRLGFQLNKQLEVFAVGENLFDDESAGRFYTESETRGRIGIRGVF